LRITTLLVVCHNIGTPNFKVDGSHVAILSIYTYHISFILLFSSYFQHLFIVFNQHYLF